MNTMGQVRKVLVVAMVLLATVAGCGRELKAQEVGDYEALRNLVVRIRDVVGAFPFAFALGVAGEVNQT